VKKHIYILILLIFSNINALWSQGVDLSEEEAYILINQFFKKDIENNDITILFNKSQLFFENYEPINYPPIEELDDTIYDISSVNGIVKPNPRFTDREWKIDMLKGIIIYDSRKGEIINDHIKREKYFIDNFGSIIIHNVSYPRFIFEDKIAVIIDEKEDVSKYMDCIPESNWYLYIKENSKWKSLKEYGTSNIYLTLENYYNSTSR
jgi:hypothetical protein